MLGHARQCRVLIVVADHPPRTDVVDRRPDGEMAKVVTRALHAQRPIVIVDPSQSSAGHLLVVRGMTIAVRWDVKKVPEDPLWAATVIAARTRTWGGTLHLAMKTDVAMGSQPVDRTRT